MRAKLVMATAFCKVASILIKVYIIIDWYIFIWYVMEWNLLRKAIMVRQGWIDGDNKKYKILIYKYDGYIV